jgi:hypothetical protein
MTWQVCLKPSVKVSTFGVDRHRVPNLGDRMDKLEYTVTRGKRAGITLTPHRFEDGYFRAHKTNSRNDPEGTRVRTEQELVELARQGYHVRMSNPDAGHAPSTVKPDIASAGRFDAA